MPSSDALASLLLICGRTRRGRLLLLALLFLLGAPDGARDPFIERVRRLCVDGRIQELDEDLAEPVRAIDTFADRSLLQNRERVPFFILRQRREYARLRPRILFR